MSDAIEVFFDRLGRQGHERLLRTITGTIRFDLDGGGDGDVDHWHLTLADGRVSVCRERRDADTVIRTDRDFFVRMARGEAKALAAWLRNDITAEGRFRFLVLLERLFAEPPGARHPREAVRDRREST